MFKKFISKPIRPIFRLAKNLAMRTGMPRLIWQTNLNTEIDFWDRYLKTKGLEWKEGFQTRINPLTPIDPHIEELLPVGEVSILDVGAGPLTCLGKVSEGRRIDLTAVDPLAAAYDKLLAKYDVVPPLRTVYAKAEILTPVFRKNQFDLVHARNCIDHSFNPLQAFEQMLEVVKIGGFVIALHEINEGKNEGYAGLHQWNFFSQDGEFLIGNREGKTVNVSAELRNRAEVRCDTAFSPGWLVVRMKKIQ